MPRLSELAAQEMGGGLRPSVGGIGIAPYGVRHDGSGAKSSGYMGALPAAGGVATEYSIGVDIGGQPVEVPSIVPTLTPDELRSVLSGQMTEGVARKAREYALARVNAGRSPFAGPQELRSAPGAVMPFKGGAIPGVNGSMQPGGAQPAQPWQMPSPMIGGRG